MELCYRIQKQNQANTMLKPVLIEFFEREVLKLKEEISLYHDEAAIWKVSGNITNPAGNLCLHLLGNLQHFIGAILGKTGYIRQRDLEFSDKNVPRQVLLEQIDHTIKVVKETLQNLSETDLFEPYPVDKHGKAVTTYYMLAHLLSHFNYHLGQVNYHRRLIDVKA